MHGFILFPALPDYEKYPDQASIALQPEFIISCSASEHNDHFGWIMVVEKRSIRVDEHNPKVMALAVSIARGKIGAGTRVVDWNLVLDEARVYVKNGVM